MVALKMVVDGTLIVPDAPPVIGGAGGRRVADRGYSSEKVSCKMIQACDALDIIQKRNRTNPEWINRDLYRLLFNPTLHVMAYERMKSKPGNMTEGTDGRTLDGFSMDTIQEQIVKLRSEQYQPTAVRRVYIPKENGRRPLGVPSPLDKTIQECVRLILEAIYEPNFHENSHGFRPGRSCHTALESLRRNWVGTKWVLKLDIAECFERVDHYRLLDILREKIQDDRFINLIRKFLDAGYMENWVYHRTYSGTPQGSVISPILTNIYLDKLDQRLDAICEQYSQGKYRQRNWCQINLMQRRKRLLEQGEVDPTKRKGLQTEVRRLNHRILQTPAQNYHDPSYTRVKFLRYADDVVIGVIGPKSLAIQVKAEVGQFLKDDLKLQLNEEKTCILHLPTEKAHFLGYEFKAASPRLRRRNLQETSSPHNVVQTIKTGSGNITLLVPLRMLSRKLTKYMANGQPTSRYALTNQPVDQIVEHYNSVIRGWYNYFQLAENVGRLHYARYVLRYSLAKTLAHKEGVSMYKIFRKYGRDIAFTKPNGRPVHFFNEPLKQVKKAKSATTEVDAQPLEWPRKTQTRLLDQCAICGNANQVEMHHVRHIRKRGQHVKGFTLYLAAINRKQIPVCRQCHRDIHNGKYDGHSLSSIVEQIEAAKTERSRSL